MSQRDRHIGVAVMLAVIFGIAATGLLGSTLVLGLLGAESAVMWTGSTGCICLAGWLLAANADTTGRRELL
jgi:hypothetical protein